MNNITCIKDKLSRIEKRNWREACQYLYSCWYNDKNNGELCMLLIEETTMYLMEMEAGRDPGLHLNNNASKRNKRLFIRYKETALSYGLENCLSSKYFVWRLCYLLLHIETYLVLLDSRISTLDEANSILLELLDIGKERFPDSLLLLEIENVLNRSHSYYNYNKDPRLAEEIKEYRLQNNIVDQEIMNIF